MRLTVDLVDMEDTMESKKTRELCAELVAQGAKIFACVASLMQTSGWPDRYISHIKWSGWLEMKDEKTVLRTNQKIVIRDLRKRHTPVAVLRFVGDVLRLEDEEGNLWVETDAEHLLEELAGCMI